ncbi:hypothetical protein Tsubulata_034533 [Turnera subulata]|uniref:Uncharacterized protein n=1 Tax=Turnera subulata TaxID=218843 RepID=A0A9Q0F4G1_9ROSI|nr:hypothetical protein Tsubulata_034533 [Turnera subulata]
MVAAACVLLDAFSREARFGRIRQIRIWYVLYQPSSSSFPPQAAATHLSLISVVTAKKERRAGAWYSTGLGVAGGSALIYEVLFECEVPNSIHLTADTGFRDGEGAIKAYVSVNFSLGDRTLAAQFQ